MLQRQLVKAIDGAQGIHERLVDLGAGQELELGEGGSASRSAHHFSSGPSIGSNLSSIGCCWPQPKLTSSKRLAGSLRLSPDNTTKPEGPTKSATRRSCAFRTVNEAFSPVPKRPKS